MKRMIFQMKTKRKRVKSTIWEVPPAVRQFAVFTPKQNPRSAKSSKMLSACYKIGFAMVDSVQSEGFVLLEKDEKVLQKLEKEDHVAILYEFILAPDKIPVNSRAKRRFAKYDTMQIDIKKKRQYMPKYMHLVQKIANYVAEKHNVYYFRAEKALMLLLLRSNYKTLKRVCPRHIDIFYEVLTREVLVTTTSKVDMAHVLKLIQYFILQSPTESIKNIIKFHICYELLAHCDYPLATETLIGLLTPGDNYFKIEDKDRVYLAEYLKLSNFGDLIIRQLETFKINAIYEERGRVSQDPKMQEFCNSLLVKMAEPSEKRQNFLLRYFHSIFNKDLLTKFHKQPEELFTKMLNVDRIPPKFKFTKSSNQSTETAPNPRKLVKSTTIGNMESLYDVIEGEELVENEDEERENMVVQKLNSMIRRGSINIDLPLNADGYLTQGQKNTDVMKKSHQKKKPAESKRSKILHVLKTAVRVVMCNNLFLLRPQKKTQLKQQRKAAYNAYPEKISLTHPDIRESGVYKSEFLAKAQKLEHASCSISEIIYGIVSAAILQKTHRQLHPAIRLNVGSISLLTTALFKTDHLILGLLKNALMRLPLILENKAHFESTYWSLKSWLVIAKNM